MCLWFTLIFLQWTIVEFCALNMSPNWGTLSCLMRRVWWPPGRFLRGGLLAQFSRDYATTTERTRSCLSARLPKWAQNWANFTATTRPDRNSLEVERRVEGVQSVHTEVETLLHIRSWVAREGDGRSLVGTFSASCYTGKEGRSFRCLVSSLRGL